MTTRVTRGRYARQPETRRSGQIHHPALGGRLSGLAGYTPLMHEAELDFRGALQEAINECRRIGYKPTGFMGMMTASSAFEAVRTLLTKRDPSEGFTTLWEKGRLDLTVEAIVLKPEWRGYFALPELETARRRLTDVGYRAPWDDGAAPIRCANDAEIESLLIELAASNGDVSSGKRIRARLRALGHYGGLRQRERDSEGGVSRMATMPNLPLTVPSVPPPIPGAGEFLERIRSLVGLPERNHEDVVKELLVRLGHDNASIVFQRGRIDLCVLTKDRKTAAVFEVKRTIVVESERAAARRQGMDYAGQTGAIIVVITDGDRYEVYDRRKGHDYDAMQCGKFQLTAFRHTDTSALDVLRPEYLRAVRS